MPDYKAPIRDIQFVLYDLLEAEGHYQSIGAEEATRDLVDAIISEGSKFAESILAPLHQIGDKEGCKFNNGVVTTPPGFKEAYAK
ncbi:MAG: acyl-CoA dehydrogenase N-terminal domain-containing protein, partial [Pseudomonadota bacterium]|nr:acyl-CoA dehydrogenase N-terminal domain-containing protein [Pseudomonadota bacterium]